jgi:hypothetical protein
MIRIPFKMWIAEFAPCFMRKYSKSWKIAGSSSDKVDFLIYIVLPVALWP